VVVVVDDNELADVMLEELVLTLELEVVVTEDDIVVEEEDRENAYSPPPFGLELSFAAAS
jgi:hypothetical protein